MLYKRVDKHFGDVLNPSAEHTAVIKEVWKACEAEMQRLTAAWKGLIEKCYPVRPFFFLSFSLLVPVSCPFWVADEGGVACRTRRADSSSHGTTFMTTSSKYRPEGPGKFFSVCVCVWPVCVFPSVYPLSCSECITRPPFGNRSLQEWEEL